MNEEEIKIKLDQLASYQRSLATLNGVKQSLIDAIYTDEIKAKVADIEAEFAGKAETANKNIADLTTEIKKAVVESGVSVKSTFLHAVYSKGRISWDPKSLDGYAVGHPEILNFRKEGEPSVGIRPVQEKEK